MNSATTVLVTGGSGFIGSHCINQLLSAGYTVRTTVRSLAKEELVRKQVTPESNAGRLDFYEAELLSDKGWTEATTGCDYVLHVASPFPPSAPKTPDELVKPALEGTLRVLRHALAAGVKRVVLTSSFVAIGYGKENRGKVLDESDWTDPYSSSTMAYPKSKTVAELAAWDFVKQHPELELSTINPVLVTGPLLPGTKDLGTSIGMIKNIASGKLPAAPVVSIGAVDVRDVAALHLLAMTRPEAKGERFLAIAGNGDFVSLQDFAKVLNKSMWTLPDWVIKAGAYVSAELAGLLPEIGTKRKATNAKARKVLSFEFRTWEESVLATVESLKTEGLL